MTGLNKNQLVLLFDLLDHNMMGKIGLNDFCITVCILSHEEPPSTANSPNPSMCCCLCAGSTGGLVFPAGTARKGSPLFSGHKHCLVFHVFFQSRKSALVTCF